MARAHMRSRVPLRVLATLLLVDGRLLSVTDLVAIASAHREAVYGWHVEIGALRAAGCQVETGPAPRYGYRLAALPPDDLLDDVLLMARQIQDECPSRRWELLGYPMTIGRSQTRAGRLSA